MKNSEKNNKKLAICITAYNAEDFILETIYSLNNQKLPDSWEILFYIGVDSCKNTAGILDKNRISYYWSSENVGTYILTNSLLQKSAEDGCDAFLRFDSDDIAFENFIYNGIYHIEKSGYVRGFYQSFSGKNFPKNPQFSGKAHGVVFFNKNVLNLLGGYHGYRVSCDAWFNFRAEKSGFTSNVTYNKPCFFYRLHQKSLTKKPQTALRSDFRRDVERKLQKSLNEGEIKIENPVTVELEYRRWNEI